MVFLVTGLLFSTAVSVPVTAAVVVLTGATWLEPGRGPDEGQAAER